MAAHGRLARTARLLRSLLLSFAVVSCADGDPDDGLEPGTSRELAPAGDRWITLGEDALSSVVASFQSVGATSSFAPVEVVNGVAVARVEESRLALVARVMHESFHRCAGFIVHESLDAALAAASASAEPQPVAVDYVLDNAAVVQALLAQVQAAQVRDTIVALSAYPTRHYTSATGVEAASWLRTLWQGYAQGRGDVTVELYAHAGYPQPSVILTIPGSTLAGEVVVIGGHLDSINTFGTSAPGADDDASGIASISEAIRVALAAGYRPLRTVKFIAYAAEEVGLRGSTDIANAFKASGVNVVGVLQLDMTNYKGSSVDVGLLTDRTSAAQNQFIGNLIDTYLGLSWASTQCGYACSDHVSWTNAGFPSSLPFEALMGQHNGAIHSANDTLAQSGGNADHAAKFTRIAVAYVAELAKGTLGGSPPPPPPAQPLMAVHDATLGAPRCAAVGIGCDSGSLLVGRAALGPEVNRPNTIHASCADGTSGTFHSDESNDRLRVVSVDGTTLAPGKTVRVEATVWAYSTPSADKLDLYRAANASSPSWTFLTTLTPPARGAQTLTATYTLPAGGLQAVRARFRYNGSAAACGTGAYDDHDDLVFAVGGGAPADTTPPSVTLTAPAAGSTVGGTASLAATAADDTGVARVDFLVDGVVKGSDATAPYALAWNTTTAANGAHLLQAKAYDAAGNVGTSGTVGVTVSNAPPAAAVYDATLRAPRCSAVGSVCDSGTLLVGRGLVGNEPNRPNTIHGSCADGSGGTYHVDESNDRIRVLTTDGTSFAPGKTVRIEATVWAYSSASLDRLDLYTAANASSPSWTFLTTITPPGSGARTLSATYTLPSGSLQAVRARFRYQGSAAPCGSGSYNDHDDLVFAVSP